MVIWTCIVVIGVILAPPVISLRVLFWIMLYFSKFVVFAKVTTSAIIKH